MTVTVRQLAELVQGNLLGDGDLSIHAARPLAAAREGDITFVEDAKHLPQLRPSKASAAVVPLDVASDSRPLIQVRDPLNAFVAIARFLNGRAELKPLGVDPRANVHAGAIIGPDVSIYPFATVEEGCIVGGRCRIYPGVYLGRDCRLGDDVVIHANAVLYDGTIIGHRSIIHANTVLGADGFGYRQVNGKHVKVPQLGHVEIGDDVEIGACTTIDRGTFQATLVGDGTKIDNLVQVGHNCAIGRHNLLVAQMGIGGSSSTGDNVIIAGQVGIVDHVHIGERAIVGAGSGVPRDVPPGQVMLGAPALPVRDQKRILVTMEKLPDMSRDIRRIKRHLGLADKDAPTREAS